MKSKFKVAAIQEAPVFLDKNATIEKACGLIKEASRGGASLVVFPEAFISAYPDWVWVLPPARKDLISSLFREFLDSAVSAGDGSLARIGKAARESEVYVALGVNERNDAASKSSVYNTLVYIGPDGSEMGRHRKLVPTGGERLMWAPGYGSSLVTCESDLGRLGGLICWENFMPLARMTMYMAGVQIYVAPTWDSSESWQVAIRHIAREGAMFVISCAQAVRMSDIPDRFEFKQHYTEGREWVNKGNSCIAGPDGKLLAGPLDAQQGILYAEIDLEKIPDQKWLYDVAGHYARPDIFEFAVRKY